MKNLTCIPVMMVLAFAGTAWGGTALDELKLHPGAPALELPRLSAPVPVKASARSGRADVADLLARLRAADDRASSLSSKDSDLLRTVRGLRSDLDGRLDEQETRRLDDRLNEARSEIEDHVNAIRGLRNTLRELAREAVKDVSLQRASDYLESDTLALRVNVSDLAPVAKDLSEAAEDAEQYNYDLEGKAREIADMLDDAAGLADEIYDYTESLRKTIYDFGGPSAVARAR